jgi:hypothetical protein
MWNIILNITAEMRARLSNCKRNKSHQITEKPEEEIISKTSHFHF